MPQTIFENGDPNFVDERTSVHAKPKEKKSILHKKFDEINSPESQENSRCVENTNQRNT